MERKKLNRALVVQTAFLGDVILTTPLVSDLSDRFEVHVLTTPQGKAILSGLPFIANVIEYDKKGRDRGIRGFLRISSELKKYSFDEVYVPHPSFRSGLLSYLSGAARRTGFNDSAGRMFFNRLVSKKEKTRFIDNVRLLYDGDRRQENTRPILIVTEEERASALELLARKGIGSDDEYAAINPCSVWHTKEWHPEKFGEIVKRIYDETGMKSVILGMKDEHSTQVLEVLCEKAGEAAVSLVGETSLSDLKYVTSRARVFITNDSGPMHIASAFGIPIIAIFGPTTKDIGFFPPGDISSIVEVEDLECRPCGRHGHMKCPQGHFRCMELLDPDRVMKEVRKWISR